MYSQKLTSTYLLARLIHEFLLYLFIRSFYRNTTVDLVHIDTPPNMSAWPHFHNGVAAGLRIANSTQVRQSPSVFYFLLIDRK